MKDVFLGLALYITGVAIGFFVVGVSHQMTKTLGTTHPELSRMKEECEHSLPRNQHCIASVIFLPTAFEE